MKNRLIKKYLPLIVLIIVNAHFLPAQQMDLFVSLNGQGSPHGIALDKFGNIFTAMVDQQNKIISIIKIKTDKSISDYATIKGDTWPCIAVDTNNIVYLSVGDKICSVSDDNKITVIAEGLGYAGDIKFDKNENMYVTNYTDTIYVINKKHQKKVFLINESSGLSSGIDFDRDYNYLYVICDKQLLKYQINSTGSPGKPEVIISGDFEKADYVAVDNNGYSWITDWAGTGNIYKISPGGKKESIIGSLCGFCTTICIGKSDFNQNKKYFCSGAKKGIIRIE
jgi:sugar lactone lactonase YvrE